MCEVGVGRSTNAFVRATPFLHIALPGLVSTDASVTYNDSCSRPFQVTARRLPRLSLNRETTLVESSPIGDFIDASRRRWLPRLIRLDDKKQQQKQKQNTRYEEALCAYLGPTGDA